ncbi:MAG TPA: ribonuclease H-like domain-containing protein [Armatimonadota bacterium]|nr:ribonuclease H-like domain-containing protein [Armatimonadota bacterium]
MRNHVDALRRLEKYLGGPLRPGDGGSATNPPQAKPSTAAATVSRRSGTTRRATLEEAVPGYAVRVQERGTAYKIMTPVHDGKAGDALRMAFTAAFSSPGTPAQQRIEARCRTTVTPDDLLFFDLETTGLSQTPLFLIGTLTWENENLIARQFLARDYREEAAVIQLFLELAATKRLLISFNGKSYDLPFVQQRAEMHDIPSALHVYHFDLLHESRRVWHADVPNCQLQTLEQHICGHTPRSEDIPSEKIPAVYKTFIRNGNALQLAQIIRHNFLDLTTMVELLAKLPPLES